MFAYQKSKIEFCTMNKGLTSSIEAIRLKYFDYIKLFQCAVHCIVNVNVK